MLSACLFEDDQVSCLHPATLTRPVDQLRIGIVTIYEKWKQLLENDRIFRLSRPGFDALYPVPPFDDYFEDEPVLWIRSRFIPGENIREELNRLKQGEGLRYKGLPVVALMDGKTSKEYFTRRSPDFSTISFSPVQQGWLLERPFQLFEYNGEEISKDFARLDLPSNTAGNFTHVIIEGAYPVYMEEGVVIEPGVIILSEEGPVFLGRESKLLAGAIVRGPAVIDRYSIIKMSAKIYPDTTIGPHCKVGGEVNNVIFQSHSNKGHDGFLGNSYIGEWCNLGADTNNSNLKNNYRTVRLADWTTRESYDTGLLFCGMIMGDHCKTAINTMINTGSIFGVFCNIATDRFPPKFLPSFSWLTGENPERYDFDKAIKSAEKMMSRRDITMSDAYRDLMHNLFTNSALND